MLALFFFPQVCFLLVLRTSMEDRITWFVETDSVFATT
jgi:hypothetical protein